MWSESFFVTPEGFPYMIKRSCNTSWLVNHIKGADERGKLKTDHHVSESENDQIFERYLTMYRLIRSYSFRLLCLRTVGVSSTYSRCCCMFWKFYTTKVEWTGTLIHYGRFWWSRGTDPLVEKEWNRIAYENLHFVFPSHSVLTWLIKVVRKIFSVR